MIRAFRVLAGVFGVGGLALIGYGFYDFATAKPEEGAPVGFFLLAVGGFVLMMAFGFLNAGFGPAASSRAARQAREADEDDGRE